MKYNFDCIALWCHKWDETHNFFICESAYVSNFLANFCWIRSSSQKQVFNALMAAFWFIPFLTEPFYWTFLKYLFSTMQIENMHNSSCINIACCELMLCRVEQLCKLKVWVHSVSEEKTLHVHLCALGYKYFSTKQLSPYLNRKLDSLW